jgi:cell division septum initiation protein DivIVA
MMRTDSEQLTPQQVRSANFSAARFGRRGLDEGEVRSFCEWVADGVGRLVNDNNLLHAEIVRLRERLLDGKGNSGVQPEDGHVQAVYVLSKAQQTADRYVADAQEYSRELAEDARLRRDEILGEAKMRASMILEEAHNSGSKAAEAARNAHDPLPDERQELQAEIAYLRTYSDVCRTHLRAYMESLTRSIEEWERIDRNARVTARESARETVLHTAP